MCHLSIYTGTRNWNHDYVSVVVQEFGQIERPLCQRSDLIRISRTGYEWGMLGAGARQLAFALLCDAVGENAAIFHHALFALDVVSVLPRGGWSLTDRQIKAWYRERVLAAERECEGR